MKPFKIDAEGRVLNKVFIAAGSGRIKILRQKKKPVCIKLIFCASKDVQLKVNYGQSIDHDQTN